ncbi:MAG: ATP-binding cassette domain-containing protein, partial [Actinobacteria bacterium]|nr:ATP-binding cassette domain-containing protein [Actinomycetota bacterium]
MTDGQVLEFSHATKRFGALTAVDDLSARIEPGAVTAFLGPNGAGKTTSLRMMLGQIRPTTGTATIGGVPHAELRHPLRTIGSVLEEAVYRPRRTAPRQLTIAAKANGIPLSRVEEVLALVGLQNETETRIGAYSLGMRQRLSVAGALLGDPGALVLDEPANGLDPEGIRWMRLLMRRLADEGRTVLVSSHVLSEIEQIADNVLVLSKGRLVYADSIGKLSDPTTSSVVVDTHDRAALTAALRDAGLSFDVLRSGLTVHNTDAATVGSVAAGAGLALTTLQQRGPSLEEVFLDLVHGRREPLTGTIPVLAAPEAARDGLPAEGSSASGAVASGAGASGAGASVAGADLPGNAGEASTAGLFGAAAVPAAAAAGAGIAGLFGTPAPVSAESPETPDAGAVAVPTTRREAAEFAAAQSAHEEAQAAAEASAAGEAGTVDEADTASDAASEASEASAEHADGEEPGSDDAGSDVETPDPGAAAAETGGVEGEPEGGHLAETPSESAQPEGESEGPQSEAADESGPTESEGPQSEAADESGPTDSDSGGSDSEDSDSEGSDAGSGSASDVAESAEPVLPETDAAPEESTSDHEATAPEAEHADDEPADGEHADDAHVDESTAIAAGVALTAPIVADYMPGEPHPEAYAEPREDDGDPREAPVTRTADAEGTALGSFETAALTLPADTA